MRVPARRRLALSLVGASLLALVAPNAAGADARAACGGAPTSPFVDVTPGSTHAPGVDCLFWYGVASGVAVDAFAPMGDVRRDEMAAFLGRAVAAAERSLPEPDEPPFDDVATNAHRREIDGLAAAGITSGRSPRRFDPAAPITRAEMAAFLVRTYEYLTGSEVTAEEDAFRDDDGHALEAEINAAAGLSLVAGKDADRFAPGERTRREESATLVARLLGRLVEDGIMSPRMVTYEVRMRELPGSLRAAMDGVSWRSGCPVGLDDLRLVELVHRDWDGGDSWGQLVVHREVAAGVADVFAEVHAADVPIARMRLIERYGGDDDRSMAANNTSAFNCRTVAGSDRWSEHAYGRAIDINPVQNPYVRGDVVEPEAGRVYLDRDDVRPGMVVRPGPVVEAFSVIGWGWGGDWTSAKDYQHFSESGN